MTDPDHLLHVKIEAEGCLVLRVKCIGHNEESCNLQSWVEANGPEGLITDDIPENAFPAPLRTEWDNSEAPTLHYAPQHPTNTRKEGT